ncbi:hypothetical protein BHM03_00047552 [Ensete ventricosum]|nr:hypothetical protein BHM03_00047552 [Ensete ventricosum]
MGPPYRHDRANCASRANSALRTYNKTTICPHQRPPDKYGTAQPHIMLLEKQGVAPNNPGDVGAQCTGRPPEASTRIKHLCGRDRRNRWTTLRSNPPLVPAPQLDETIDSLAYSDRTKLCLHLGHDMKYINTP